MNAEIISIGDELTSGQRLDTNSQWLSQQLHDLGVRVQYHTTVSDDLSANTEVFRRATERVEIVVATGGLGPTADDLTRDVLATVAGAPLELDAPSLEHIRNLFARRQRPMPERNIVQAYFPRGSRVIANPHGTAPGIDIAIARPTGGTCRVFALPGVPAEMREMWEDSVAPAIRKLSGIQRMIRHHCIRCFGVGESDLEAMLPDLIRRGRRPEVGITVSQATISLRITADGENETACADAMAETIATIHQCLGDLVFGEHEEELQHAIASWLIKRDLKLAVAECATSGMIAHWLSEVASLGPRFPLAVVGNDPIRLLTSIDPLAADVLRTSSHEQVASRLADAIRRVSAADLGLAIGPVCDSTYRATGETSPSETSPSELSPGVVWIGISSTLGTSAKSTPYVGHPDVRKARLAKHALNLVRLILKNEWPN